MAKTNQQVAHLFAHKQSGDSNNLHSDGQELRSYNTVIAFWAGDVMFVSSNGMTTTTASKHLAPLRSAASHLTTFYSGAFGIYSGTPNARECIQHAANELLKEFKNLPRKRSNLGWGIDHYTERRQEIIETAARFNVEIPELPEATGDLKAKAKELQEQERKRQEERERKRQEENEKQKRIDAEAFQAWLTTGAGSFPASYNSYPFMAGDPSRTDYITIRGDQVITSQGAEAPLEHVRKAIAFYVSRKYTERDTNGIGGSVRRFTMFHPYHTNGHKIPLGHFTLDEIDAQGNVKAGCHRFTAAEIARFIEQWKEVL